MAQSYRAFLTYSHTDEGAAHWLHTRLERFVIPRHLRHRRKTLAPIFRDRDELPASGDLSLGLYGLSRATRKPISSVRLDASSEVRQAERANAGP